MNINIPSMVSIGRASAMIQRMPLEIDSVAKELGISPVARINLIDHYAEEDLERIRQYLSQGDLPR